MKNKVLALGYFDAIHRGHRMLLEKAEKIAKDCDSQLLVCTFSDAFYQNLGIVSKEVFLLSERKKILSGLGYQNLLILDTSKEFFNQTKEEFLQYLLQLNPSAIVVGSDYRFGKNASGTIDDLNSFFCSKNVKIEISDLLYEDGEKISTTRIKKLLQQGYVEKAKHLLGFEYFLTGFVKKGRQIGTKLGFPTANIDISSHKLSPKEGVYAAKILFSGNVYPCITSIGDHPTFDDVSFNAETHIFDFEGNIYNKEVEIRLIKYIRKIIKFDDNKQLVEQIKKDINFAKEVL